MEIRTKHSTVHFEAKAPLRVMQVDKFYSPYLADFYGKNPHLEHASAQAQADALFRDGFSAIHAFAPYLKNIGCEAEYFVSNAWPLLRNWSKENSLALLGQDTHWELKLLRKRVEIFRPDVLYLADPIQCDAAFLNSLSFRPPCIMTWRAADVPFGIDWTGYDILLSGLPRLLALAETLGVQKGMLFHPGMPSWIAREVEDIPQDIDVVFAGSISPTQHVRRLVLLEELAQAATQHGFTLALHLLCNEALISPAMRPYVRPPAFGLDMHKALRRGKIVVDVQGTIGLRKPNGSYAMDLAQGDTSNMRLFEATGGGSLLLTEDLPGVARYFEPGSEAAVYTTHSDAVDKILYYLAHEAERATIAAAGKARCLGEHNMNNRAKAFLKIAREHIALSNHDRSHPRNS